MEASSALVDARLSATGVDPPLSDGWVRITRSRAARSPSGSADVGVVAAATASGLSSQEDHDLIVEGIPAPTSAHGGST